ncbi:MAG: gamma-glutamyltransferase family protein [Luteitalea sp.]|nr:gamma-glutamyltransferase family protein [Luteitalea sp.]
MRLRLVVAMVSLLVITVPTAAQRTQKPPLHGRHWMAITGKPLGATAGAMILQQGGNAVDATCAMLAAVSTMWDTLGWGGETQALVYNPHTKKVIGINALGVAPTGATPELFKKQDMSYPPEYGPLAAVTPGTPGGLLVMLAEFGTLSVKEVLAPAIELADGYPIEAQAANAMERHKKRIQEWPYSRQVFLTHPGEEREAPNAGEIFAQPDLAATLRKLVEAEQQALQAGKSRKEAIQAAYDRFYTGDIAKELVRGTKEQGGLITLDDLARWQVRLEEPVSTRYKDIDVYKLTVWTQGPALLQALNILETLDLPSMGYNSARYIHALYQTMNLAFADRDFYYGDPYVPPEEPVDGLLSKEYAQARAKQIDWERNDPDIKPGDPYPYGGTTNPFRDLLDKWTAPPPPTRPTTATQDVSMARVERSFDEGFRAGTTSIVAADKEGWLVSVTPSGAWIPAVIAGRTGIGLSQRMQQFVLDPASGPFNVVEPGKHPRVTLTPSLALKDGRPYLAFAVQGGDTQDQNLLQFFLNVVEFGMTVQQATEAANITSYQMRSSFDDHRAEPGRLTLNQSVPPWVIAELRRMGYRTEFSERTSGPINAIFLDTAHETMWGGSSNDGEDYGIAW